MAASKTPATSNHAKKNLARLDRGENIPTHLPYLVQAWSFGGDLAMVFLPGEITVDLVSAHQTRVRRARTWVKGCSNNVPCHVSSHRVLYEGGYESARAMVYYDDRPTKFTPDVEERTMKAVHEVTPAGFLARKP